MIQHFITDFERNGRYTAFPALGVEWQKMESPFLRSALGMSVRPFPPVHTRLCLLVGQLYRAAWCCQVQAGRIMSQISEVLDMSAGLPATVCTQLL